MPTQPNGIFCLEGDWEDELTGRTSVEPQLRMLANTDCCGGVIHRDVATRDEFEHYIARWLEKPYVRYTVAYFAFHGVPKKIRLGREDLRLDDMADVLAGRAHDRIIYMGSCSTLVATDDELREFCRYTAAKAIVGYTKKVDWLETAAFDFLLLPKLLTAVNIRPVYTSLCNNYATLAQNLGLRMATARWATEQEIAIEAAR